VIPRSLGGGHVLLEASCADCSTMTSRIERIVARQDLLLFRTVLGLPTYRPKSRPRSFPGRVRRGEAWTDEDIPVEYIAGAAVFPQLPIPGGWEGRPEATTIRTVGTVGVTAVKQSSPPEELARLAGIDEVEVPMTWNPAAFLRLVAKVGWGFSVGWLGLDSLMPGILGVIRGTDPNVAGWIGSPPPGMSAFDEPSDHTFQVRVQNVSTGLVVANVKLFAAQGAPEYFVILGVRRWCDLAPLPDLDL
jgi:hypothetical protein